jgi:hypothetical protein
MRGTLVRKVKRKEGQKHSGTDPKRRAGFTIHAAPYWPLEGRKNKFKKSQTTLQTSWRHEGRLLRRIKRHLPLDVDPEDRKFKL